MGKELRRAQFSDAEFTAFSARLRENLQALKQLLNKPGFGTGPSSFGAELEFYIIDGKGKPLPRNREIIARANDSLLSAELDRFNLEYNLRPVLLTEQPFLAMEENLLEALGRIDSLAAAFDGRVIPIGILPTLHVDDFGPQAMTDEPRYHALKKRLTEIRGGPFKVAIAGDDELLLETEDITFEGANTSFQAHYRVDPGEFADSYNTLQLITPLVLGVACNSPTAFGRRLWQETRVPLFKKSIDCRREETLDQHHWHQPARVNYGHGWLREGAYELFAEGVRLYPPLLPVVDEQEEDSLAALRDGTTPGLAELVLHQGTVWLWNRPVYDSSAGGHLRIEMRALPAGPSVVDMIANAALAIGLVEGLKPDINELMTALPFPYAAHNFYRAARYGLDAKLVWPDLNASSLDETALVPLLYDLLPTAERGLRRLGIGESETGKYLAVIEQRLRRGITGAGWQLGCYEKLRTRLHDSQALHTMLELYHRQSSANIPVAQWTMDD